MGLPAQCRRPSGTVSETGKVEVQIQKGQQFVPHKLRLRGTFIDCEDENSNDGVTPHARSDPGCDISRPEIFESEEQYVEQLCDWQRDCPTTFDFDGMQVQLVKTSKRPSDAATETSVNLDRPTPASEGVEQKPLTIKRSSLRWSDLEDDDAEELPAMNFSSAAPKFLKDGEMPFAWDAASAANSEELEEPRDSNVKTHYAVSEPPRMRVRRRGNFENKDWQNRNVRHHTKKEVQLPPRPPQAEAPPPPSPAQGEEDPEKSEKVKREIRARHLHQLQGVDRNHLPTRFHREEQRQALSKEMQESAQQMREGWGNQKRMSTVLAAMEELPKRVGEDMHKLASHVVDSVQNEINEVSSVIRADVAVAQNMEANKVVKHLEVIPTMVLNLLESRMEKAKAQVRQKVGGMIQQLSAIHEESHEDGEELAEQMKIMSSEVAKIAGAAVEAAAQECRAHATQQLDIALATLREPSVDRTQAHEDEAAIKWQKVREIRNAVEDDLLLRKNMDNEFPTATHNSMDTALAVIKDKDFMPHSITNEVVADQLLRAKVRGRGDVRAPSSVNSADVGPKGKQMTNPGSLGHPDLCPRPCIYFRTGTCASGAGCTFCHMSHSRRPLRLDKRHREAIKKMPFKKVLKVIVPILSSKVQSLACSEKLGRLNELPAEGELIAEAGGTVSVDPRTQNMEEEFVGPMNIGGIKQDVLQILDQLANFAGLQPGFCVDFGSNVSRRQSGLSSAASTGSSSNSEVEGNRDKKVWLRALQMMNLRSLLVMMRRLARDTNTQEAVELLEQMIARIQQAFGSSAPDFEDDEPPPDVLKEQEPVGFEPALEPLMEVINEKLQLPKKPTVVQLRLSQLVG
ncbi:unnamed protein product [Effrenium voratum]|nr:unnamed protein product [Effrenium voratum]